MKAYLVQHGEAKPKEEDPDRPLSDRGRADVEKVAEFLASADAKVERILHSGKTRARQTAELLAERLRPVAGVEQIDGLDPLAESSVWAGRLAEEREDVMLVGHLPHMAKLSARLLTGNDEGKVVEFRMGGVVCLERGEARTWAVRWMVVPELLP